MNSSDRGLWSQDLQRFVDYSVSFYERYQLLFISELTVNIPSLNIEFIAYHS